MAWSIIVVEPALSWLHGLRRTDRQTLILISQAIEALSVEGPALGRPLVDTIKGSALPNLKELRPGTAIPEAEAAYADHLRRMSKEGGDETYVLG